MPTKEKNQYGALAFVTRFLYALLYYALLFLTFVGDGVIEVASGIFRLIVYALIGCRSVVIKTLELIGKGFLGGRQVVSHRVVSLRQTIRLPRFKTPVFHRELVIKIKYLALGLFIATVVYAAFQSYAFVKNLPDPRLIGTVNYPVSTKIFDRHGELLYELYRGEDRSPVELSDLPSYVAGATIAIEDKNFYNHPGVSPVGGILRALKELVVSKKIQGGSTITQQLVKSALLTPERTIIRKIREILLALWTERMFTKDEILEMYLNQVPYGGQAYGIEAAAKTYFGKGAGDLTLPEATFLAGLPQAPTRLSPYSNPDAARARRNEVLQKMLEAGTVSQAEYEEAISTPLAVRSPVQSIRAPHFVFYVRPLLEQYFGTRFVEEGGLRVTTTLDLALQERVEEILASELERVRHLNIGNAAVLVTSPTDGQILAMVGSKNYFEAPYGAFNVTTAPRQPGSAIKPLMYSLALEQDFTAATIIEDSPVVFEVAGSRPYRPVNYDGRFHGKVPLRYALANSYNVPAVKVLHQLGVSNFIKHAQKMGITTWTAPARYGLSLTLGGAEVTMEDMAVAYGTIAARGVKQELSPILHITDFKGEPVEIQNGPQAQQVISEDVAFIIADILSDNTARRAAFGPRSLLEIPGHRVAAKTGTTNDFRDNWTIGFTPRVLVAVWVGNNDNTPMNQSLVSGVSGAAPIWNRVMKYVLEEVEGRLSDINDAPEDFVESLGIVKKKCYFGRDEYFIEGTEDRVACRGQIFDITPTPAPQ